MSFLGKALNRSIKRAFPMPNGDICVISESTRAGQLTSNGLAIWRPSPAPIIMTPPSSQQACRGGVTLRVTATGEGKLWYRWRRNGVLLSDGGSVQGALIESLTIQGTSDSVAGTYDCIVSNGTASVPSLATVDVCMADFTCDGFVDGFDYQAYVAAFEAGELSSDMDSDGFVDGFDYEQFVTLFETVCD